MFGLLNIDKPGGVTSRDVVNRVAQLVKTGKVGHAGTLDPLATGVLVLCLGKATRLVPYIHEQPKQYQAVFRLGCGSDTDDVEGDVRELADAPRVTLSAIQAALPGFTGEIEQVPPRFSAVKVKGRRAYDLARRGKPPVLTARTVRVHRLEVVAFSYPDLTLHVECGSGTYVRAIGRDLGRAVGSAAVMTALRRVGVGVFRQEDAIRLNGLDREGVERALLPPALALAGWPRCTVPDEELARLRVGRDVPLPGCSGPATASRGDALSADATLMVVVDGSDNLIAIAEQVRERLVPRQVFA